jgi:AraC-like DNA-binding protein
MPIGERARKAIDEGTPPTLRPPRTYYFHAIDRTMGQARHHQILKARMDVVSARLASRHFAVSKKLDQIQDWNLLAVQNGFRLKAMAAACAISERQLRRYFQDKFRVNPKLWLDTCRALAAVERLRAGDQAKKVSADLGFLQRSHFSRFLKRVHGATPKNVHS